MIHMIEPFQNYSKVKYKQINSMFYDYKFKEG